MAKEGGWTRQPIGDDDVVTVQGRYLYKSGGERFLMQGIAFPTPFSAATKYDADGWIAVLEQLANLTEINTIRVYRMDCRKDHYTEFLERAAHLGIYVLIPLTAPSGKGVLDRDVKAPHCYNHSLYHYGVSCLERFLPHPNVLAGVLGNEVMNSETAWQAAPCLTAYGKDLKRYMANKQPQYRPLPLIYAAQHDSLTAEILPETAMKQTADYLACRDDDKDEITGIDIFGINVESWCSSRQTFDYNEDGTSESGYHALHQVLQNSSIPLVFTEMGCSQHLFNRDNGLSRYVRDWAQVPVVLQDMSDTFSGFSAYTYSGSPDFNMMAGDRFWNGHDVLEPGADFDNFARQLQRYHHQQHANATSSQGKAPILLRSTTTTTTTPAPPSCRQAVAVLERSYNVSLYAQDRMPQFSNGWWFSSMTMTVGLVVLALTIIAMASFFYRKMNQQRRFGSNYDNLSTATTVMTQYQSINSLEDADEAGA